MVYVPSAPRAGPGPPPALRRRHGIGIAGTIERPLRVSQVCTMPSVTSTVTVVKPMMYTGLWLRFSRPPISRPMTPPNTQESCNAVSERPNADARLTSGRSR